MTRRSYGVDIVVNGLHITEVIIDSHYEKKHPDVTDEIICRLVLTLDGKEFVHEMVKDGFQFYMLDRIPLDGKLYRLVWCMQDECIYIGVINAFRR
jgi:hypothetical protein